ncbi:MAG: nucleotidyltransferase family protein [Deltaproteobacteria bacterium]|nr:nucleotidyltransferase family protein [Deltaproteobacteria bacterium]
MAPFLGKTVEKLFVSPDTTIYEAMSTLDKGAKGVVLVVEDNILRGIATDGDFRRALLRHVKLSTPVKEIMVKSPQVAMEGLSHEEAINRLKAMSLNHLPLLDERNRPVDMAVLGDLIRDKKGPEMAVIMAGGMGMRLRPLTENVPKPMLNVAGKPVLEWIIRGLIEHGVNKIWISLRHHAQMVQKHFGDGSRLGITIDYLIEDEPRDTAGALSMMTPLPAEPFLVMNGDILTTLNYENLFSHHLESEASMTVTLHRYELQVPYGVVNLEGDSMTGLDEKPSFWFHVNAGIYVISPEVIKEIPEAGRFSMTDLIRHLIEKDMKVDGFPLMEYWLDIGRHPDYERAKLEAPMLFK